MNNFLKLFGIAAWALGTIGGIGYCLYFHHYLIAVAIAILGAMAFPTVKKWFPSK